MDTPEIAMVYSLNEAAETLRISLRKLYHEIDSDRLHTFKIGNRRLVSREALATYIRRCEKEN